MKIGFKRGNHWYSGIVRALTRSQYSHGCVEVQGRLYESTALKGEQPHAGVRDYEMTPDTASQYTWYECSVPDELALQRYEQIKGKRYDYVSLLAFLTLKIRDVKRLFCYEVQLYMLTGAVNEPASAEVVLKYLKEKN